MEYSPKKLSFYSAAISYFIGNIIATFLLIFGFIFKETVLVILGISLPYLLALVSGSVIYFVESLSEKEKKKTIPLAEQKKEEVTEYEDNEED